MWFAHRLVAPQAKILRASSSLITLYFFFLSLSMPPRSWVFFVFCNDLIRQASSCAKTDFFVCCCSGVVRVVMSAETTSGTEPLLCGAAGKRKKKAGSCQFHFPEYRAHIRGAR